ncbi:nitroreductase family protein [Pseudomaricurvus sp.]|uniref:nitroreductase family protein n=1 Tax=Pseudomaricurvus sp. TaxID=2004510 RepID=UPI003F6C8A10
MEATELLLNRVSCGKLTEPAPTAEQREVMYRAALRAADHGNLQPWRFLEVEGEGLERLGELYAKAALQDDPNLSDVQRERFRKMPLRAPLVIVAIAKKIEHPKVPHIEQILATGAAAQNLINGAFAVGVGAYWRSGAMAEHPEVKQGLGLEEGEQIIGFIYLGTRSAPLKTAPKPDPADFFHPWPAK